MMLSDETLIQWPELTSIPPPTLREFRIIFGDIDYAGRGWITAAEVRAAFDINALDIKPKNAARAVRGMVELSREHYSTSGPPPLQKQLIALVNPDDQILLPAFSRCLYFLSIQQREVLPRSTYAVFPDSAFSNESSVGLLKLRHDIWHMLDSPSSSSPARAIAFILTCAIFISTAAFCLETLPGLHRAHGDQFATIEAICVTLFTVEVFLRVACTPDMHAFIRSPINWIDFLSIAPFFIDLVLAGWDVAEDSDAISSSVVRAVRLVRVFRLLKTGRYLAWLRVFGATLSDSLRPLFMLFVVASIVVVTLSSVEYFLERGRWEVNSNATWSDGTPGLNTNDGAWVGIDGYLSGYTSIPATFWWCVVTLTGVGYGEVGDIPITQAGKFFASACFFCGIVLSSVPISLISGNFHISYTRMERLAAVKVVHAKQQQQQQQQQQQSPTIKTTVQTTSKSNDNNNNSTSPTKTTATTGVLDISYKSEGEIDMINIGAGINVAVSDDDGNSTTKQNKPVIPDLSLNELNSSSLKLSEFALNSAEAVAETLAMEEALTRIDAAWSEPFLRLTLIVTRNSRRSLMSRLKALELSSRERLDEDLQDFLIHIRSKDRAKPIVERAAAAGLA